MSNMARRQFLVSASALGGASAVGGAALLAEAVALGAEPGKMTFAAFDKIEPQKFAWGWIRWLMNAKIDPDAEMTLGVVQIEPHQSNPMHVHPNSAEYVHVVSGSSEHLVGDRWVTMKEGDTLRIPKGVVHMARTKDQPCRSVVVYNTGTREMVVVDKK